MQLQYSSDTPQRLQCVCSARVPPQRKGICDPPSKTFYDGTLSPADSVERSYQSFLRRVNRLRFALYWTSPDKPIKVIHVVGSEVNPSSARSRSGGPESKQNPEEAERVVCPLANSARCNVDYCEGLCFWTGLETTQVAIED